MPPDKTVNHSINAKEEDCIERGWRNATDGMKGCRSNLITCAQYMATLTDSKRPDDPTEGDKP